MIDYIKIDLTDQKERVLDNPVLDFETPINPVTGEFLPLRNKKGNIIYNPSGNPFPQAAKARLNNLVIEHSPSGQLYLSGSLHKFFNILTKRQDQNYDDFTYENLISALKILKTATNIDPSNSHLLRIEYGVNLDFHMSPKDFISQRIMEFASISSNIIREKFFTENMQTTHGYFLVFERSRDKLKVYDKGIQYGLYGHKLRVEINELASNHNNFFSRKPLLSDLYDLSYLSHLATNLIEKSAKLLLRDTLSVDDPDPKINTLLQIMRDPVSRKKMKDANRFKYFRTHQKYVKYCKENESYYIDNLVDQIRSKACNLLSSYQPCAQISTRIAEICAEE